MVDYSDAAVAGLGLPRSLYLATHFTSNGYSAQVTKLHVSLSTDGIRWTDIGGELFGTTVVRDPSSYYDEAAGRWWICYTAVSFDTSDYFALAYSYDLVNWVHHSDISIASLSGTTAAWAPEFFVDDDGSVHIIVTQRKSPELYDLYEMHPVTAGDFSAWSAPALLTFTGAESHTRNDNFIVKRNGVYYLFFQYTGGSTYIHRATATSLTGPYTIDKTGDWAGWGISIEGPCIARLANGVYRAYLNHSDLAAPIPYTYSDSADLETWSTPATLIEKSRWEHGTVRAVTSPGEVAHVAASVVASWRCKTPISNVESPQAQIELYEQKIAASESVPTALAILRNYFGGVVLAEGSQGDAVIGPYNAYKKLQVRVGASLATKAATFGDTGMELHPLGGAVVLASANGTRYKLTVSDAGAVVVTAA